MGIAIFPVLIDTQVFGSIVTFSGPIFGCQSTLVPPGRGILRSCAEILINS
jgi:hypothetical protein